MTSVRARRCPGLIAASIQSGSPDGPRISSGVASSVQPTVEAAERKRSRAIE
jgi:hypothetical protein